MYHRAEPRDGKGPPKHQKAHLGYMTGTTGSVSQRANFGPSRRRIHVPVSEVFKGEWLTAFPTDKSPLSFVHNSKRGTGARRGGKALM